MATEKELRDIIDYIYNLITLRTEWETRSELDREIIDVINNLYLKEK